VYLWQCYVAVSFAISTLLQIGVLVAFPSTVKEFSSGPYGFIFSSMALIFLRVPRLHNLSIFGIPITDKFFAYLIAAQMAFSNSPSSLLSAVIGILTGCIYHFDVVGLQRILPPQWLQDAASKLMQSQTVSISQAPLQSMPQDAPGSPQAETLLGPAGGGFGGFGGMPGGGRGGFPPMGAHQRAAGAVQVNQEHVESLMAITGMPRQQVESALIAANNNPDAATAQLMRLD